MFNSNIKFIKNSNEENIINYFSFNIKNGIIVIIKIIIHNILKNNDILSKLVIYLKIEIPKINVKIHTIKNMNIFLKNILYTTLNYYYNKKQF